ncbi:MAG: MFS transporter [Bryobacterales bacterium]|nr:MFS transporter [Bryobacterales bacterium]
MRLRDWIPALCMTLVSLISYIDRNTLALLAPTILQETGLSGEQYGWIISAFSVTYMIGNPVWGRWLDRIGLLRGMTVAVGFWTLASVSHAFASGFRSFAVARAALGFGEGATFPGGLRTVVQTLPPHLRARGIAVAYSGGSLGAVVTPLIVTPIALAWGWRGAFWFTGLIGAFWLVVWRVVGTNPKLRADLPAQAGSAPKPDWGNPRLWGFMAVYALGSLPLAFVLYNASLYLGQVMGLSQAAIGGLLWIPPLGWETGYFVWGTLADRGGLRDGSAGPQFLRYFLGLMLLSLPLCAGYSISSVPALMGLLFFSMFVAAGYIIVSVAYATSVFSQSHAGFLAGLGAGSWSALVAVAMPLFGRLFDQHEYAPAFVLAALFPAAGTLLWWALDSRAQSAKA